MRMRSSCVTLLAVSVAVITAACSSTTPTGFGSASTGQSDQSADQSALGSITQYPYVPVCERVRPGSGSMRCLSTTRANPDGTVKTSATPSGFGPSDLRSAYNLPASGGNGRVVALVDAYDDPTAESDLAAYRAQFGLPACTSASGCFTKVSQTGSTTQLPAANSGWSGEISLDVDMVSAACPDCKILLVEASSADDADLGAAVDEAATLGAAAISNSYGGGEDSSTSSESGQYYNHPGILVTASAGDQAYGAEFPATSQYVLAIGGTSLVKSSSARGWAESAWSDGGSGCSAYIAKPSWQTAQTVCSKRMEADISAIADPNTGVAVYQSGAWQVYGGTSVASPLVAGIFTLLDLNGQTPQFAWTHTSDFYDVTSGKNGSCGTIECTAGVGYDGPTGWGTPNGTALAGGTSSSSSSGSTSSSSGSSSGSTSSSSGSSSGSTSSSSGSSSGSTSSSGSSSGSSGSSSGSSSSGGGGSCSHAVCASGVPLTSSCSTCAGDVCAKDPYCCQTQWDSICVSEVPQDCPGTTCGGGGGGGSTCAHNVCKSGAALGSTCSTCSGDVCTADPYCCAVAWDKICVSEVNQDCGAGTCP